MDLINKEIEDYAYQHTIPESELLQEVKAATENELRYSDMLSGRVEGSLLQLLIRLGGARRVLELGMFTGYSALAMAEALPDNGEIITCEMNERYENIARRFIAKSPVGYKIEVRMGEALDSLKSIEGPFDLVFMDADKANYPTYYNLVMPMLKSGGLVVVDNALWSGKVLSPDDHKSKAIDELNRKISADSRVEHILLTMRDGIHLVRKR